MVFGFTWSGLDTTIYHTRDEHANHYTTDEVVKWMPCTENDILTKDESDIIQPIAVCEYYEILANAVKGDDEGRQIITVANEDGQSH